MDGSGNRQELAFLDRRSETGRLLAELDWSATSAPPPEEWPQSLRTATSMMLSSSQPMFIAWGPDLTFIYNDAYVPVLGDRHPQALGARFKDIWSDIWDDLLPLIEAATSGRSVWQEDLPLLMHRHGYPEQTYFSFTYSPLYDESDRVQGMFCACIETTGRVVAEARLRETAEALTKSQREYRSQSERLFALFENAPGFLAVMEGPNHVFTLTNAAYRQLIGHRDVLGLPVREALPELASVTPFFDLLDQVYQTGEPFVGAAVRVPLQRAQNSPAEDRFVDFVYQPIRNEEGAITGIIVQGNDVTGRQLLVDELNHRVKNNLATVQSLAAQTAKRATDLTQFRELFEGRLIALSRTHDILAHHVWEGADLLEIVKVELDPVIDQVTLEGPDVKLSASVAMALSMIMHELVTNAAKYGALSAREGRIHVSWSTEDAGRNFALKWVERGGPAAKVPDHAGFGHKLIRSLVRSELHGKLDKRFPKSGLELSLSGTTGVV